jgi:hypothetical protein
MLKTKRRRIALVAIVVFSMIAMYGGVPAVYADSMDSAKVTLSDSDPGVAGTVTVLLDLGIALTENQYLNVNFENGFTTISNANAVCPDGTAGGSGQDISCTADADGYSAAAPLTITINSVTNPGTVGDYSVTVSSHAVGGAVIETTETKVYIIDDVTVSAHVAASLTFSVTGTDGATVNGDATTGSSSPWAMDFGTLTTNTEQRMAQELRVSTNADAGYSVTVQQDHNMANAGGSDINSFDISGPTPWAIDPPTLSDEDTYGFMGLSSNDGDLAVPFGAGEYQGLDSTTPLEVMSHGGPADGSTPGAGLASVIYNIQITDLQEAGDYSNNLTYICTPTY